MLVYRLETADGRGPYIPAEDFPFTPKCLVELAGEETVSTPNRPCPYADNMPHHTDLTENHRYGFQSLALYKLWFEEETRKKLAELGARLSVYKSHAPVVQGGHQCLFDVTAAEKVAEYHPHTLEPMEFKRETQQDQSAPCASLYPQSQGAELQPVPLLGKLLPVETDGNQNDGCLAGGQSGETLRPMEGG